MNLEVDAPRMVEPVSSRDHVLGAPDAPVTLVEYGDYECPYCGRADAVLKALLHQMRNQLRYVYRNFPLTTIHPHAALAAQAAEAAALQGKFWEMHDALFEHQEALDLLDVQRYAWGIGLEVDQLVFDLASEQVIARVQGDFRSGVRSGVNGTPTFFVNGVRYSGPSELGPLARSVDGAAHGHARH